MDYNTVMERLGFDKHSTSMIENLIAESYAVKYTDQLLKNGQYVLDSEALSDEEKILLMVGVANVLKNKSLIDVLVKKAVKEEVIHLDQVGEVLVLSSSMTFHNTLGKVRGFVGGKDLAELEAHDNFQFDEQKKISDRVVELVCLGVSITNGCKMCTRAHFDKAKEAGIDQKEMELALNIVAFVNSFDKLDY
ncbi:carboxymuconolactone decarboxylase family protein [Aureibacter tunicatorum]|uniref:AhpD family alkylhydroperoxidase n=1 Tax=Aureibacter tunicatorum TaxID=866807 RepID=A0AAE4BU05_9BACT|nr:carboxymuconolactone decarboxylase family protein [Aureibacter tunicatorum]MDR6241286.1 AhpD family alkylhydroperoxidase [Aureibacter tunicatorum]